MQVIRMRMQLPVEVECPECGTRNGIDLFHIEDGDTVKCRGCGRSILLKIEGNGIESVKKSMRNLEKTMRDMRNIKLEF
jgi:DNA-directed RNA polymerase subunit RPC12/RpoP